MKLIIEISEDIYKTLKTVTNIVYGFRSGKTLVHACLTAIRNGIPLPKGHGDLIDRSKLEVCSIDITDLPTDKGLMVYYAEDVDKAPAIIKADNESEAADL